MMSRLCVLAGFSAVLVIALPPARAARKIVLVAGGGGTEAEGPAARAKLSGPFGADFNKDGATFIVEMTGQRVLMVNDKGVLTHLAGTGKKGNDGDGGPAARAEFNGPHSLAVGPDGV